MKTKRTKKLERREIVGRVAELDDVDLRTYHAALSDVRAESFSAWIDAGLQELEFRFDDWTTARTRRAAWSR